MFIKDNRTEALIPVATQENGVFPGLSEPNENDVELMLRYGTDEGVIAQAAELINLPPEAELGWAQYLLPPFAQDEAKKEFYTDLATHLRKQGRNALSLPARALLSIVARQAAVPDSDLQPPTIAIPTYKHVL